jgi:hypothetical protein
MFAPQFPLSSEFIKILTSTDPELEYQELVRKIVIYMSKKYCKLITIPSFHLFDGSTTDRQVKSLQTLSIDTDLPSDDWLLKTYQNTTINYVKFYIFSSSRISPWQSVYTLDTLIADDFIADGIADTASGFDKFAKIKRKNRGLNILAWLLPTVSFYGKEKNIYVQLKGLDIFRNLDETPIDINSSVNFLDFLNSLGLSEEIIKVEEGEVNDFLLEKDRYISNYLGKERFKEMLHNMGIEPELYFSRSFPA